MKIWKFMRALKEVLIISIYMRSLPKGGLRGIIVAAKTMPQD